jgi:L-alanine-DL-glutamate epimerase-like enolase superfamily enzyme
MKITAIETIPIKIPFEPAGKPSGWGARAWSGLECLLVRVETSDGLVGWGDAFSYACQRAVKAALDDMVTPLALGHDPRDRRADDGRCLPRVPSPRRHERRHHRAQPEGDRQRIRR